MDRAFRNSLVKRLALMFGIIVAALATYGVIIYQAKLDLVLHAQIASVVAMLTIFIFLYSFLLKNGRKPDNQTKFVYFWFITATLFNLFWQIPLTLFRHHFLTVSVTHQNLLSHIAWWGYGFADSHYRLVDYWMMSEEAWWLLAIVISIAGLVLVSKKHKIKTGYLLLGIAGLLQAYNATLYIVYDLVSGMGAITNSAISLVLYWGFNLLWPVTALTASVICFKRVLNHEEKSSKRS